MNAYAAMTELSVNFIHKRIASAGLGFITGGPGGAIGGFFQNPADDTAIADPRTQTGCQAGQVRDRSGNCINAATGFPQLPGRGRGRGGFTGATPAQEMPQDFADGFGGAVMGRFGAALQPAQVPATRLMCPRGSVLGRDNLCYDHLPNRDRKWKKGAKPLLTGGEMNTLRKARRLEDRLKRIGCKVGGTKRKSSRKLLR